MRWKADLEDSMFLYHVNIEPKQNPMLLMNHYEEKKCFLLDLLKKDSAKKKDKSESASDKSGSEASDAEGEDSSDADDFELEKAIVYGAILPEAMQMEERTILAIMQPSFTDNVVKSSFLNMDNKYCEVTMKNMPRDEDEDDD